MSQINSFAQAVSAHGRALKFIFDNRLAWFFVFPAVISVLSIIGGFYSILYFSDILVDSIRGHMQFDDWFPWLGVIIQSLLMVVIRIVLFLLMGFLGGYIVLIFLSPFLAYISQKTESVVYGTEYTFDVMQVLKDALVSILFVLRNSMLEILIIIAVFVFSCIPILGAIIGGLVGTFFLCLVSAYFYGFSFVDYTHERRNKSYAQRVRYARTNKGMLIGVGLLFTILLFVPILGAFIASFMAVISTVAATLLVLESEIKE